MLTTAAGLIVLIAGAHSVLGEIYILRRLFKRTALPKLFGDDRFTKSTLRFAWHLTTVAWLGFAGILGTLSNGTHVDSFLLEIIAATFFISGLAAFILTKGKHLSWLIFFGVAALTWLSR